MEHPIRIFRNFASLYGFFCAAMTYWLNSKTNCDLERDILSKTYTIGECALRRLRCMVYKVVADLSWNTKGLRISFLIKSNLFEG